MPTVSAFIPKFYFPDSSGNPGNAWKIYTYAPGTVTPQSSYTDSTGNTANANPVIADSRGEINLWLDVSLLYKIVVKDSSDVTIWTVDNFNPVYDNTDIYVATVGGTVDVITLTPTTPLAAYAAGQKLYFIASGANTTNVTVNVSGLGAKALTKNGTTALVAGDIPSGALIGIQYDGTRFQVIGSVTARGAITSSDFTMSTARLLGRTTAATGAIEELSVAGTLSMTGGVLTGKTRLPIRASAATETLVAADMGKMVVTSTASTLTLPLLSAVTDGDIIGFHLNAGVSVTVQRQGTNELSWNGLATLNSVRLASFGDYLFLVADTATSRWRVLSEHIQGPFFRAQYEGVGQSIGTNTVTKLQFNTETADSHGYYDPTTNFRFTPLIPGWYMVSISAYISGAAAARSAVILFKNGVEYTYGQRSYSLNDGVYTVSSPVQMNGTTDYVEAYGITIDAAGTFDDTIESNFTAVRIR